jgi:hypothetical protein
MFKKLSQGLWTMAWELLGDQSLVSGLFLNHCGSKPFTSCAHGPQLLLSSVLPPPPHSQVLQAFNSPIGLLGGAPDVLGLERCLLTCFP